MTESADTTTTIDTPADAPPVDLGAPEPAAEDYAAAERTMTADGEEPDTDEQPDDDPADLAAARKQAAKYRERLRAAEAERDNANELLTRTRQSVIDTALTDARIDPRLLAAAGHSVDSLTDPETGMIDRDRLAQVIEEVRGEFRIGGFTPNRAQGGSGQPPLPAKPSLADAFRQH